MTNHVFVNVVMKLYESIRDFAYIEKQTDRFLSTL